MLSLVTAVRDLTRLSLIRHGTICIDVFNLIADRPLFLFSLLRLKSNIYDGYCSCICFNGFPDERSGLMAFLRGRLGLNLRL
jgi:hypothetical protein